MEEERAEPAYVVGIGASAGGLEALEQLFAEMPRETGLAFVVVQHLSPDFRSVMDELLARRTPIPVTLVEDGVSVEPDHIYLIPPKKEMIISGGRLLLSDKGTTAELVLPIDIFFRSLAQDCGARGIAVVLSGGGSDGSRGIRDVHEAGGLVLCQDELSAAFDGMPRSARDTGIVDQVLAPKEMPAALLGYMKKPAVTPESVTPPRGIHAIYSLLQQAFGIDFSHYKPTTVLRRIDRRLHMGPSIDVDAYVEQLARDPAELDALYRDLLIGVTRFFRDIEAFELLERHVIPELLDRVKGEEIRVWVPGCATGEEAYSLAILFHEALTLRSDKRRLKVFATDVHPGSLEIAARGLYDAESIARVTPPRLARYFERHGRSAQVSPDLRQMIVFARHNVTRDAPFTRVDLLSCRNMLIYLQPLAQKKVLGLFHFALKNQGVLFLGPSETPGAFVDDFEPINPHWRIYKKQRELRLAVDGRIPTPRANENRPTHSSLAPGQYNLAQTISIYDALLEEHMPASLLVNERRELVHAFGGAGRFVRVRDGRPSLDVLDLVEPDLKMALAGALQRSLKERQTIVYQGVRLHLEGQDGSYKLSVRPVHPKTVSLPHLLISIERSNQAAPPAPAEKEFDAGQVSRDQVENLENELRYTKENLQATIEEVETSNEELQATNEELLAANEELQSTNEELQSVNEELFTVNAEYQKKIAQLTELTNDMDNLLLSTDVGTIFLDEHLKIRKFTPRIAQTFDLLPHDVGRPLANFSNNLDHPNLIKDLAEVVRTGTVVEREARDGAGNWFFLRLLPYRAAGMSHGAVLTLVDMNGLKAAEDELFRERFLLESLMDGVPDLIYFKDSRGRFVRVNQAMAGRLGVADPKAASGRRATDFVADAVAKGVDGQDDAALRGEGQPYRLEKQTSHDGHTHWFMTTRQPLRDRDGNVVGMYAILRDVTEQKHAEDEIRSAVTRRDQFLAMLSHELRNPLGAVVTASRLLAEHCKDARVPREIEIIERQSHQMARLLDDLLESNRFTQNKIELAREVLDLRAIIDEAAGVCAEGFEKAKLDLHLDVDEAPLSVDGDSARIQQVVVNLLGNAAKYGKPGGNVWLSAKREGEKIVIRVKDDGIGIDPNMLTSIFDMFVQVPSSIARTEGGMGVGLALVRTIVEMHGGEVAAESEGVAKGSTFTVTLPARAERPTPESGPNPRRRTFARGQSLPHTTSSPLTIAIVDDNEDSCEMLQELLRRAGHDVEAAFDGETGAELIERIRPDVAIVDIGLPKLTGYEVAQRIRGQRTCDGTYLVALTGYGSSTDRAAATKAGFDEHLVKPFQPRDLDKVLGQAPASVRNVRA